MSFWEIIGELAQVLIKAITTRDAESAESAVREAAAKLERPSAAIRTSS